MSNNSYEEEIETLRNLLETKKKELETLRSLLEAKEKEQDSRVGVKMVEYKIRFKCYDCVREFYGNEIEEIKDAKYGNGKLPEKDLFFSLCKNQLCLSNDGFLGECNCEGEIGKYFASCKDCVKDLNIIIKNHKRMYPFQSLASYCNRYYKDCCI